MTSDHEDLMRAVAHRMVTFQADMEAWTRWQRKAQRHDLAKAKRIARMLRRSFVIVAGHHLIIPYEYVERWVGQYMLACTRLGVTPPIVRVPRSLRYKFGVTIGGKPKTPKGWDAVPFDDALIYMYAKHEINPNPTVVAEELMSPPAVKEAP